MESVFESIGKSVVFLFDDTGIIPLGTGFLIGYPSARRNRVLTLLVTARHIIAGRSHVIVRYSSKGTAPIAVRYQISNMKKRGDLWYHPDDGVDIAVLRVKIPQGSNIRATESEGIATKQVFGNEDIKITDRVFFPGLLLHFYGNQRNYPIARTGFIAQISEEPIPMNFEYGTKAVETSQRVILIDGTAIPGASGSPVFLVPGFRVKFNEIMQTTFAWLIGIIHGFYDVQKMVRGKKTEAEEQYVIENTNVAIAFPSWRILEITESRPVQDRLEELKEDIK